MVDVKDTIISLRAPDYFEFESKNSAGTNARWNDWLRRYKSWMVASGYGAMEAARKVEIFYVTVGPQVENVVLGLAKGSEDYDGIIKIADDFFQQSKDTTYETLQFRKMQQEQHETLDEFVVRLKHQAKSCEFKTDTENQVRLQVIAGARSKVLRRRILEENWDLENLLKKAKQADISAEHATKIESDGVGPQIKQEVCRLEIRAKTDSARPKERQNRWPKTKEGGAASAKCFKCG